MTTAQVASWVTSLDISSIPQATQHAALRSLYNYLGCTIHGSTHPTTSKANEALHPFFSTPTSSILGTNDETDAQHAALLNGIASHVHDYDDTHLETIIHPTGPTASALLAYTQHTSNTNTSSSSSTNPPISGPAILTALTAGIEVSCKLGLAISPRHYDAGWHITSTTGSIGAAIAVGKLMNLTPIQLVHAIGIAATQATGLRSNFGTDTKAFHVGRAAQNGLMAAILAQQGFTSHHAPLEAGRGWANVLTGGTGWNRDVCVIDQLEKYIGELGVVWEIDRNAFKPFPCGIVAHPAIDAAIRMRRRILEGAGEGGLVQRLKGLRFEVRVNGLVVELTNNKTPRDGLEAKFSVYHGVAVGLVYGRAGPEQYTDEVVRDENVVGVRGLVEVVADEATRSDETVMLAFEGQSLPPVYSVHVEHAIGSLDAPMTDEQLTTKFVDQVSLDLGEEDARRMSDLCWKIGEANDVAELLKQLRPN